MKKQIVICIFGIISNMHGYSIVQVNAVKKRASASTRQYINASRIDGRGADLSGINVSSVAGAQKNKFDGANFSTPTKPSKASGIVSIPGAKTNLQNSNFTNTSCVSTNFQGALLQGANFSGANIEYANFSGANLIGANFNNVEYADAAIFCGAIMPDGNVCNSGTWSSAGVTLQCHCPKKK